MFVAFMALPTTYLEISFSDSVSGEFEDEGILKRDAIKFLLIALESRPKRRRFHNRVGERVAMP